MRNKIIPILITIIIPLLINCSQEVTGGGMDVGNPYISGVILTDQFEGAENVSVHLLPSYFNPYSDSLDFFDKTDITDFKGSYSFYLSNDDTTEYSIWAVDSSQTKVTLCYRSGITIKNSSKILYDILQEAVNLTVFIPDTFMFNQIYTYIPGTPYKTDFKSSSFLGDSIIELSSIPQGILPAINIVDLNTSTPIALTDTLKITNDSIQSATAFEVWTNYSTSNTVMSKDTIYSVFQDSKGIYWFGTFGGGIYKINGNNWINYTISDGLKSNVNLCFEEDSAGNIWCGTGKGIAIINNDITIIDTSIINTPKNGVFEIERDIYNRLWMATGDGLTLYDHGSWSNYDTSNSPIPKNLVYSIDWLGDSLFIATFGGGLAILSANNLWDTLTMTNSPIPSNYIYTVKIDSNQTIWLGTTEGVAIYKNNNWTIIKDDLPHDNVWSLAPDNLGGAWFGTQKGIVRYKNGIRNVFTIDNSTFLSTHTFAITANDNGVMFGTGAGATIVEYDY